MIYYFQGKLIDLVKKLIHLVFLTKIISLQTK